MKLEAKDIKKFIEGSSPTWGGIIKNNGRFGLKQIGVGIFPSDFEWQMFHECERNIDEIYIFKESEFCNTHEYHESKLILLQNENTLHENPMNPHTGRPIEVTIQKPIMKV